MDSTTSAAHRRVGAAAVLAFLALLLLGLTRNSAAADPVIPVATPAATPPAQPQEQPQIPRFYGGGGDGRGFHGGGGDGRGFGGGGVPGGGGGQTAPAPSAGGSGNET